MAIDERGRHQLFVKLEQVIGNEEAITLMEHLPPGGYAELATKQDLAALERATKRDLDAVKHEILAEIRHDISNQTRTIVFSLVAVVVSISSVALFR